MVEISEVAAPSVEKNPEQDSSTVLEEEFVEIVGGRKYLKTPVKSGDKLDPNIIDPIDGSIPRIKTPRIDVVENQIAKQVIVESTGVEVPDETKCFVHMRVWRVDEPLESIEDTRMQKEPVQILVGEGKDKPHMAGLARGLRAMRVGERALLQVKAEMAYGSQGHFSFPHVPPNTDLVYDVEVLGFELEEEELPRADQTFEERCRQADKRRLAGNELYKQGDLDGALAKYTMAISYFGESFMFQLDNIGVEKYITHANSIRVPLLLNLAQCHLKKGNHNQALDFCSEILETDKENVKALYRRGCARWELGQEDGAIEDLTKAQHLAPDDSAIKSSLHKYKIIQKKGTGTASKELYGGLFGEAPAVADKPKTWTETIGGMFSFWKGR